MRDRTLHEDEPEQVDRIYDGRAMKITISGFRTGAGSALRLQRLTKIIRDYDIECILIDVREADYPDGGGPAVERLNSVAQMLGPRRVALMVRDARHPTALAIIEVIGAAGHETRLVETPDAAETFFFPPDNVLMID